MYGINHPERIKLNNQIKEWNANRLDLFQISEPNDYLEFYGVMRFFYQGDDLKYQTKCLRVSSTANTLEAIEALVYKFHPEMKMLNNDKYFLYENHNLEDRRMKNDEHPLIVQLNWASDDKDGKFILKNESRRRRSTDITNHKMLSNYGMSRSTSTLTNGMDNQTLRSQSSAVYNSSANFFTRRFSNSKKSKRKDKDDDAKRLAEEISGKPPESSFTRTISNPDDVMKRRRQKKLEFRLEQFSGAKGDGETGGTLKIYGDSINPDIPYKTLLLSVNDTVEKVLSETLDKYGVPSEEYKYYILVQQNIPSRNDRNRNVEEIVLHKYDCPLGILVQCPPKRGSAIFAVRRATKHDKFPASPRMPPVNKAKEVQFTTPTYKRGNNDNRQSTISSSSTLTDEDSEHIVDCPRLRKLIIEDDVTLYDEDTSPFPLSSLVNPQAKGVMPPGGSRLIKIGSQPASVGGYPNILISSESYNDIRSVHCHIGAKLDPQSNSMKFYLTPSLDSSSRTPRPCVMFVNQRRIDRSTVITNGDIIQLGDSIIFRFEEFEDEYDSINSQSINSVEQESFENSSESLDTSNFTSDLPVTVKYRYDKSEHLVEEIMKFSKEYVEKGSKELFCSNFKAEVDKVDDTFRLSPAYTMYLVMRASLGNEEQIVQLINSMAELIDKVIQDDQNNVEKEVFWLSNSSELLHLIQYDTDLRHYSGAAQDILATTIERAFSIVQQQFSEDLIILLPALLNEDDLDIDDNTQEDNIPCLDRASVLDQQGGIDFPIQHLLQTLSLAFNLFQNCQVNVALTIQMFSQLFHLLNTWLFNSVLGEESKTKDIDINPIPVCQEWGNRLTRRLNRIRYWSEINSLDMAANCHLQKMYQVAELMEADKRDLTVFGEKCLEMVNLNGAQLHHLLINCQDYELPAPWIEVVVNTAIQLHDQEFNTGTEQKTNHQNKSTLPLYEDMDLRLPLLLPADGYCCDRGIASCPSDLKTMLSVLKDLRYYMNAPISDEMDIRWKSYLGTCDNTPTVSRSNTIELLETFPLKTDSSHVSKNRVIKKEESEEISSSETVLSQREHFQKKGFNPLQANLQMKHSTPVVDKIINGNPKIYEDLPDNNHYDKLDSGELFELKLTKIENSLGLSIIAAKASSNDIFRIYVKDVIVGGAGYKSEKIFPGDQIVSIDGYPLEDMNQDEAVVFMKKTKSQVSLIIDRGAAQKHGVMQMIIQARNSKMANNNQTPKRLSLTQGSAIKPPPSKPPAIPKNQLLKDDLQNKKSVPHVSLPPPPGDKIYSRPSRVPPSKNPIMANRKENNLEPIEPDFSSLPIRKSKSSQPLLMEVPLYATVKKGQSSKLNFDNYYSLQDNGTNSSKSTSQPNLNSITKISKKLPQISSSESDSSRSISSSSEEEEENSQISKTNIENNGKRNSSSVYDKKLQQNQSQPQLSLQVPIKAVSDMNIQLKSNVVPRHEISSSENELRNNISKKPLGPKHVIPQYSDPIINSSSQDDSELISLNKPVLRNQSISSETETISSNTESTSSSEFSSKLQRKFSSEPDQKTVKKPEQQSVKKLEQQMEQQPKEQTEQQPKQQMVQQPEELLVQQPEKQAKQQPKQQTVQQPEKLPVQQPEKPPVHINLALPDDFDSLSKESDILPQRKISTDSLNLGGFKKPFRLTNDRSSEPLTNLPSKESLHSPKSLDNISDRMKNIKKEPNEVRPMLKNEYSPVSVLPPPPNVQYHPPSDLQENDWSCDISFNSQNVQSLDDIKLRRKALSESIRQQTEENERKSKALEAKVLPSTEDKTVNNKNSTKYGRPKFNDSNQTSRPISLFTPDSNLHSNSSDGDFNFPSPPSSMAHVGVVVPPSPIIKSKVLASTGDHFSKKPLEINQEDVDELSFKEKMKLFASKTGEDKVMERQTFGSKQRKIQSGDYT